MSLLYGGTFWGYRKGSRANSNYKFIGIKHIKCYFPWKIHLLCNNRSLSKKKKALLKLIDNGFFSTTVAHIYTIEFQKRGLSHIHLLIFFHPQYRIWDSHHINSMISAQLPDPQLQPLLYAKVTKYMLHCPCDVDNSQAKYIINGKYSKCFPKKYRVLGNQADAVIWWKLLEYFISI